MSEKNLDTENKILIAARKIFAESGFGEARIDEIARVAQVNKAMIYYHFKNKDDLYLAVIKSFFESDKMLSQNPAEEGQPQKYWDILIKTLRLYEENVQKDRVEKSMLICREMVSRGPTFQMIRDKYWIPSYEHIQFLVQKGIDSGEFATSENPYFIAFSIVSHIVFYSINEVTYKDSTIYPKLYPENYSQKMEKYLIDFLRKQLNVNC